jgi:uncharacterized membrane protein
MSVVILLLSPLQGNPLLLFIGSVVLTTTIEGVTGFVMEKLFHHRWWDYSDRPFNIGGYVCLLFSLLWGFACMLVLDMIHPPIRRLVAALPTVLSTVLLVILYAILAADIIATLRTIAKLNRQLGEIDEIASKLRALSDEMTEDLSGGTFAAMDKGLDLQMRSAEIREALADRRDELKYNVSEKIDTVRENLSDVRGTVQSIKETAAVEAELARLDRIQKRQERIDELVARQTELLDRSYFGVQRMMHAFHSMRSTLHNDAFENLKRHLKG